MDIRALRTLRTDIGNIRRGETTDKLTDPIAKSLIKRGLAELVDDEPATDEAKADAKPKHPPKQKGAKSSPATSAPAPEGD